MANKIKSIKTYNVNDNTDEKGILSSYEERDKEGNIILHIQYNEKGEIEQKSERLFNDKGQLIEEKQYTGGERPDQHIFYDYNDSGKVKQAAVHYLDGSISFRKYSRDEAQNTTTIEVKDNEEVYEGKEYRRFDSEGKLLDEIIYDEENNIAEKTENEYDDYGRIIENVVLDSEGFETVRFYDYYLDDHGRVNKIETLDEDEIIKRIDEIEYDERGNQIKHVIEDKSRGLVFTDAWEYNLDNRITAYKRMRGDQLIEEIKTRYNSDNLLAERETLTSDGMVLDYFEYSFF